MRQGPFVARDMGRPAGLWGIGLFFAILLISVALVNVSHRNRSVYYNMHCITLALMHHEFDSVLFKLHCMI